MPLVSAIWEAEAGGPIEPRNQGQKWQHKDNYHKNVVNQILIKIKMLVVVGACLYPYLFGG
jgi:hypothetical protein